MENIFSCKTLQNVSVSGKKELNAKRNYNSNDNLLILEKARTVINSLTSAMH